MPKIGTRFVKSGNITAEVILYYIPGGRYNPFFAAIPVNKEYESLFGVSEYFKSIVIAPGRHAKGVKGDTEQEAIDNFKSYLEEWAAQNLTREPFILIKIEDSGGRNHFYVPSNRDDVKQTACRLSFEYMFCYRLIINGKEKYFEDGVYDKSGSDSEVYRPEEYTIIPGTSENLVKCEDLIKQMNLIGEKLKHLFSTPDLAIAALHNHTNLLS